MQNTFDTLIDSFIRDKVGIAENFLSIKLAEQLKGNMVRLLGAKEFLLAGTGNEEQVVRNKLVRSDKIYWLDRSHNDLFENDFFDLMDAFVSYLNNTCYTGITGYEFHYALYEKGSFYKKHVDQFKNNHRRKFSMIMYLNTDWKPADGGELCIHQNGVQQNISPESGRGVFFKSSELEHEVLPTQKPRMSITGWLTVA